MSERKDKKPIKENTPQEEAGQEVQEVTKDSPLYDMEALDKMTPEELQAAIAALPPEQQEEYQKQTEEAAKKLIIGFKPAYQSMKDYDKAQKDLQALQDCIADAAQLPQEVQEAQMQAAETAAKLSEEARQQVQIAADVTKSLTEAVQNMFKTASQNDVLEAAVKSIGDTVKEIGQQLTEATKKIMTFYASDSYKALQEALQGFSEWYNGLMQKDVSEISADELISLGELTEDLQSLLPYIQQETTAYKKEAGRDQVTVEEFFRDADPKTGEPIESIYSRVLQRAKEKADLADLPKLESISKLPSKYVIPNNPIANSLAGRTDKRTGELVPVVNAGGFDLPVLNSGKKNEVTAYTMISLEGADTSLTMTGRPYTEYDSCVMNSVVSLWEAGNKIQTPDMICRAMSNKTETEKVSPQAVGAVTKSLEKMRHIFVKSDLSEEMRKRKVTIDGEAVTDFTIDNYLLSLTHVQVTAGGKKKDAYRIDREPVLLEYSRLTGQLITVNAGLLDVRKVKNGKITTEVIPTTEARQPIKEYLLKRIEVMKHDRKNKKPQQDQHILFDTLYRETGTNRNDKTELKRTRDYSFQVLDYWTAAGYIAGYEIIKQGQKLYSILIKL